MTRHEFFASIIALFAGGLMRKKEPTVEQMNRSWNQIVQYYIQHKKVGIWQAAMEQRQHIRAHQLFLESHKANMRCGIKTT